MSWYMHALVQSPCGADLEILQVWAEGSDHDTWSLVHETHQV